MAMPQAKIAKREPSPDGGRNGNTMPGTEATRVRRVFHGNGDIMALLAALLPSNQHGYFAEVSKEWRDAWGDQPKHTQAVTSDFSVSQLQWSFDGGLIKGPRICFRVAEHCSLDVLRYAHSNGCQLLPGACFKAVARGNLAMIQ
ncbi:unnamed protein product, partial [Laminaria digitata]